MIIFQKSFNRPELHYEVRPKPSHKKCVKSIAEYVKAHQLNQTGIIDCGTQALCERVCGELQEELRDIGYDDKVGFYHAGMTDAERERVQKE